VPELPEVETARRGLAPALRAQRILGLVVRERRLRVPLDATTEDAVAGQRILNLRRRAKYLILELERGALLLHLGMSGSLRLVTEDTPYRPHDHVELVLANGLKLRFHDPRRFGLVQWTPGPAEAHPSLSGLGPEPLAAVFDGAYLHRRAQGRRAAVKTFIMDQRIVVGVGNIYASESLHLAGIHPARAAGCIAAPGYERLATSIKTVLEHAIEQGGTTLRDFVREDGAPGYFSRALRVYGRADAPCLTCGTPIQPLRLGQRASFFCPHCQR